MSIRRLTERAAADWKGRGMYLISKCFAFEAAHFLPGLPESHQCSRVHGHSYRVEALMGAELLTAPGFVVDFRELGALKRYLDQNLDHRMLNDVLDVAPTSENLAKFLFDWCAANLPLPGTAVLEAVRVSETTNTWAEYRPTRVG